MSDLNKTIISREPKGICAAALKSFAKLREAIKARKAPHFILVTKNDDGQFDIKQVGFDGYDSISIGWTLLGVGADVLEQTLSKPHCAGCASRAFKFSTAVRTARAGIFAALDIPAQQRSGA